MRVKAFLIGLFAILFLFLHPQAIRSGQKASSYDYDILIKNGLVYDGSLKTPFRADIAIKEDKIVKVGKSLPGTAARLIEAKGFAVMPGFIDMHTHVDDGMYFPENRACLNYLLQGVTTIVVGQCGSSAWPIFEKAEDQINRWSEGIGLNAALLIGHGTVRQLVMGMENRPPTPEELEKMKALTKEAMEQGAYGLSTGLIYAPSSFGKTDEIIELVKVIAPYGGIYHSHIRNEADKHLEAIKEAIEISEKTGVRAHISHFKVVGRKNWGKSKEACALIEEAQKRGVKITADQYPYEFANGYPYRSLIPRSTWLGTGAEESRLTSEAFEKTFDYLRDAELIDLYKKATPYFPLSERHQQFLNALPRKRLVSLVARSLINMSNFQGPENERERALFWSRLSNPAGREKIRQDIKKYHEESVSPEQIMVGICVERNLEGKSLREVAAIKGKSIEDTAIELELMGARCIPFQMGEEDIEYIMKRDYVATGSDGTAPFYGIGLTHIRSYSTFLHKIKKYSQERRAVSVAHVVRSQTSLPAQIMNWDDRGWIKEGCQADIVVLDLNNIKTPTSISSPHQYSQGVKYLLVNGEVTIDKGKWTGKLGGKVLKLKQP